MTGLKSILPHCGAYISFEGSDGVGKTTTMQAVVNRLKRILDQNKIDKEIIATIHPGATQIGSKIRDIVKSRDISINPLPRQMLHFVDAIQFIEEVLNPALESGSIVFGDRSTYITGLIYGLADGVKIEDIEKLMIIKTPPKMDRLYVLTCPYETILDRLAVEEHRLLDQYDSRKDSFKRKTLSLYENLVITSADITSAVKRSVDINDVKMIDSLLPLETIVANITDDICDMLQERYALTLTY